MHTKTDSDITSPAPSSPTPPAYFVQSPSHDGEKTTSLHSTPVVLSPLASPPNYQSSHHSRESSSTRFSGSRKIIRNDVASKKQKHIDVIKEDGVYDNELKRGVPRRCHVLGFVVGFFVLFLLFWLVLWGVSKPQKPEILVKSIKFENFLVQSGADFSGVPTYMVSMNSTVKLTFRNTATFFGVHVASTPLDLYYSYIPIGSGAIKKFYQSRKSQRLVSVLVSGNKIPLYGVGSDLNSALGVPTTLVPLKLKFVVKSRGYVLGKLVEPKFNKKIECSAVYDSKKHNAVMSLKNSCTYR